MSEEYDFDPFLEGNDLEDRPHDGSSDDPNELDHCQVGGEGDDEEEE